VKVNKMSHEKFRKLDYLSVKVVPVEKGEPKYFIKGKIGSRMIGMFTKKNGEIGSEVIKDKPPKGTWYNNENLDKIKFPCFCSYITYLVKDLKTEVINYGEINKEFKNDEKIYTLSKIDKQRIGKSVVTHNNSLKDLIKLHDIHILKGKIILWEEE